MWKEAAAFSILHPLGLKMCTIRIIKSGRQLCNESSTSDPKKLNARIDTLKHLYNSLGDVVTSSKNGLEKIIRLLTQFNSSTEIVVKWLGRQKHDRLENNNHEIDPKSVNETEAELRKCHQVYDEYKTMVDSAYLADISDRLNLIDREFNEFLNLDSDKKTLNDMLQTLQNTDQISIESLKTFESNLSKISPGSDEVKALYEQVKKIISVSFIFMFYVRSFPLAFVKFSSGLPFSLSAFVSFLLDILWNFLEQFAIKFNCLFYKLTLFVGHASH
jgi:hypothetical protein